MISITGDKPALNGAFKSQLVDWYLHRVYEELDGQLTMESRRSHQSKTSLSLATARR